MRDKNIYNRYNAYILHSKEAEWPKGQLKAFYDKTGFKSTYEQHWFMADHSQRLHTISIEESGVFRNLFALSLLPNERPTGFSPSFLKAKYGFILKKLAIFRGER